MASQRHGHRIHDESSLHKYYTEVPNTVVRGIKSHGLSVYAKWLYVYLKSVTGKDGVCYRSTTTIATESGISRGQVSSAKQELASHGLISVKKGKNPRRDADHITIKDIWLANMQEFSVQDTNTLDEEEVTENTEEHAVSVHNTNSEPPQCSQYEQGVHNTNSGVHNTNSGVHNTNQRRILEEAYSKNKPPVSYETSPAVLTPEWLVAVFNAETPLKHPKVLTLTEARRKQAAARLRQFPDPDFWHGVMAEISQSPLLLGQRPSPEHPNFKGDFDWVLSARKGQTENCVKVSEGRYRDNALSTLRDHTNHQEYRSLQAGQRFVERHSGTERQQHLSDGDDAVIDGVEYRTH